MTARPRSLRFARESSTVCVSRDYRVTNGRVLGSIFHFPPHFLRHGFGIIPAPGSFATSAFPIPPGESFGSLPECSRSPWEQYPLRPRVPQGNGAEMEKQIMYLYVKWNSF
jgi:hypothetical protein